MISNLEYYRVFFAVASFRHFTRAAEYLCVSQSAVSQSIRKLETELGCRLFERSGKGLVLTAEGEELFTHIKKAMQEIHTGENSISKLAAMKTGELQIGATETSLRFYILEQIRAFKEKHPQIRITFHGTTMQDLCHQLQNEEIEVGFLISPIPEGCDFNLQHLCDIQDIPVASAEFPIDFDRTYELKDLVKYPMITTSADNTVRKHIDDWFLENGVVASSDYTVRAMGLVTPLVRSRLGIGILAEEYVRDDIESGKLIQIKTTSLPKPRSLYIGTNHQTALSEAAREFIRHFV